MLEELAECPEGWTGKVRSQHDAPYTAHDTKPSTDAHTTHVTQRQTLTPQGDVAYADSLHCATSEVATMVLWCLVLAAELMLVCLFCRYFYAVVWKLLTQIQGNITDTRRKSIAALSSGTENVGEGWMLPKSDIDSRHWNKGVSTLGHKVFSIDRQASLDNGMGDAQLMSRIRRTSSHMTRSKRTTSRAWQIAVRKILAMPHTKTLIATVIRTVFVAVLIGLRLTGSYVSESLGLTICFVVASSIVSLTVEALNLIDVQNLTDPTHVTHIPGLTQGKNKLFVCSHIFSSILGVVSYAPIIVAACIDTERLTFDEIYDVYFWTTACMVAIKTIAQAFTLCWSLVSIRLLKNSLDESIHFLLEEEQMAPDDFAALPYAMKRASLKELEDILIGRVTPQQNQSNTVITPQ
jgi:hypothetical protein